MGSIVKTIGKVIKKVGKALKKIAPILLVAAAAYVGYGYMTGFQAGGWPQITQWGQSLMGGVSQGQTLSQAANAAGAGTGTAMAPLDAQVATQALPTDSITSQPITDAVSGATQGASPPQIPFQGEGSLGGGQAGLLSQIQDTTNTRFTSLMDQSLYPPLSNQVSDFFLSPAGASPVNTGGASGSWPAIPTQTAAATTMPLETGASTFGGTGGASGSWVLEPGATEVTYPLVTANQPSIDQAVTSSAGTVPYGGRNPYGFRADQYGGMGAGPHTQEPGAMGKIAAMGKKAWEIYKGMWKDNPWMAAWTTQKVIQTIAALLDDTAEKEDWRSRHVAGFEPGGWDDVRKRYGGRLPGTGSQKTGVWAGDAMRQSKIRTGPKISGGARTSAIDRKPQGLLGASTSRALS